SGTDLLVLSPRRDRLIAEDVEGSDCYAIRLLVLAHRDELHDERRSSSFHGTARCRSTSRRSERRWKKYRLAYRRGRRALVLVQHKSLFRKARLLRLVLCDADR